MSLVHLACPIRGTCRFSGWVITSLLDTAAGQPLPDPVANENSSEGSHVSEYTLNGSDTTPWPEHGPISQRPGVQFCHVAGRQRGRSTP